MNKSPAILLFVIIAFSTFGFAQETRYLSENFEFQNGDKAYLFGDNVKFREQPNTDSKVISQISIGTEITILEKTNDKMLFDGIRSPWYKIKFKENEGFVLGGLISLDKATVGNLTYLVALKQVDSSLSLKTRVLDADSNYIENISPLLTNTFSVKAHDNKGLENIVSIFEIDYMAESCGINGGGIYLFYDGQDLIKAIDYSAMVDGDLYFYAEQYFFPEDSNGIKGKIIYTKEIYETIDYQTEWVEKRFTKMNLEWNGKKITPPTNNDKN